MRPRPVFDIDREAQIVALWQGRPRRQRRAADIDPFCQWLIDYAPWLVPTGTGAREYVRALISAHIVEGDGASPSDGLRRERHQRRGGDPA
jgi:hypothetical protein